jgi:hypothetical protein
MKKAVILFSIIVLISCKNEKQRLEEMDDELKSLDTKSTLIDTIFFSEQEQLKWNDFALVYLLDKKYSKDSICTGTFKVDFKNKDKATVFSKVFKIKVVDEGAEWSGSLELDSIASPLKRIDFGYPACGYTQNHYLFYVDGKNSNLVHEWYSSGDSGWGYWSEVISGKPEDFYFRTENFSPVDDGSTTDGDYEFGLDEYLDSIHFKLESSKWRKVRLTPKDSVYRSRKVKFDEFYKQD